MKFDRFRSIVEFNKANMSKVTDSIRDFYSSVRIDCDGAILNIPQIVRQEAKKRKYIILEMPLKDREIGAMLYRSDFWGYIFINSSLSRANVNFAMCHEFYHILYGTNIVKQTIELYIGEKYVEEEHEKMANLFSGMMLMPEDSFKERYKQFCADSDNNSDLDTICKLMNYFKAPYMSVLIRCYELNLMDASGESLKMLLDNTSEEIEGAFDRNWLDKDINRSTSRNDYDRLKEFVYVFAKEAIEEEILSKENVERILKNMDRISAEFIEQGSVM